MIGLGDDEGLGHTAVVGQGEVPVADAGLAGGHRGRPGQAQARWGTGRGGHLDVLVLPALGRVQPELGVGRPQGLENRLLGRQARPEGGGPLLAGGQLGGGEEPLAQAGYPVHVAFEAGDINQVGPYSADHSAIVPGERAARGVNAPPNSGRDNFLVPSR